MKNQNTKAKNKDDAPALSVTSGSADWIKDMSIIGAVASIPCLLFCFIFHSPDKQKGEKKSVNTDNDAKTLSVLGVPKITYSYANKIGYIRAESSDTGGVFFWGFIGESRDASDKKHDKTGDDIREIHEALSVLPSLLNKAI